MEYLLLYSFPCAGFFGRGNYCFIHLSPNTLSKASLFQQRYLETHFSEPKLKQKEIGQEGSTTVTVLTKVCFYSNTFLRARSRVTGWKTWGPFEPLMPCVCTRVTHPAAVFCAVSLISAELFIPGDVNSCRCLTPPDCSSTPACVRTERGRNRQRSTATSAKRRLRALTAPVCRFSICSCNSYEQILPGL